MPMRKFQEMGFQPLSPLQIRGSKSQRGKLRQDRKTGKINRPWEGEGTWSLAEVSAAKSPEFQHN